jgi:hypothetical protein
MSEDHVILVEGKERIFVAIIVTHPKAGDIDLEEPSFR